jgi:hypothetical protein
MGSFGILHLSVFVCGKDNIAYKDILGNLEDVPAFLLYAFVYDKDKGMSYAFAFVFALDPFAFAFAALLFASLTKDYIHTHILDLGVRGREFQQ